MATILEQVKAVNALLEAGEPANISVDTYSRFTGYKPQYIIDAMNEVFGIGGWGFEEIGNEIAEGSLLLISQVRVFLRDVDFQPSGWGQARITKGDIGDAKKGAQTDALKKALSYFSIGNRAYLGLLKGDDNTSESHRNGQQNGHSSRQPNGTTNHSKTATASSESAQASIPTVSQLKADVALLQIKNGDGSIMTWQDVLAHVFKKALAEQKVTIEALQEQELGPDACKRVQQFLDAVRQARKSKVASTSGK